MTFVLKHCTNVVNNNKIQNKILYIFSKQDIYKIKNIETNMFLSFIII